nr:HDIG domain-containing protein [Victivallales bacterium]
IISFVALVNIALNASVIRIFVFLSPVLDLSPGILSGILPLAMSAIILSVLVGFRVALYAGFFVSLLTAIQLGNSFEVVLSGMIISFISGFSVRFAKNYRDYFMRCAVSLSLVMPMLNFLKLLGHSGNPDIFLKSIVAGVASGIITAILCVGILFIVEALFRVYSNMSLLVFCDYNHPLLKMLQMEAPGTYHHSLVVSTLAEQAARDIGANPIQARVCALFHDIGKLSKPEYFTENNIDGQNLHEDLSPRMSSIVILNHVKEGIDLASKYKLPRIVCDAIEQHHGRDMISFFYKRAVDMSEEGEDSVLEWDYRYPGPLPRSKETVIVALADGAEAASRSMDKPTPSKIDALIWEIFRKKIKDGQLDDADMTIRELAIIRKSFVKTITTMMHGRISYPKDEEDEADLFNGALRKNPKQEPKKAD